MTDERLAELEAAEAKATAGPWIAKGDWDTLCITDHNSAYVVQSFTLPDFRSYYQREWDRDFIALARNMLPALIADYKALKAELATAVANERAARELLAIPTLNAKTLNENRRLEKELAASRTECERLRELIRQTSCGGGSGNCGLRYCPICGVNGIKANLVPPVET